MTDFAYRERAYTDTPDEPRISRLRRLNRRLRDRLRRYKHALAVVGAGWVAVTVLLAVFAFDSPDPVLLGQGRAGLMTPDTVAAPAPTPEAAPPAAAPPAAERPAARPGEQGEASYYSESLAGNPTASGEPYEPARLTAAHRTLPLGSRVRVTNRRNGESVVVRINDRGPFTRNRVIDLSRAAAQQIGMLRSGTAPVRLELLR